MEHQHPHEPHATHSATHHAEHRKRDDSLNIPIAIVFAGLLISGAIIFTNKNAAAMPAPAGGAPVAGAPDVVDEALLTLRPDDHILGNPNADVVLIEWSDTECPFCKRFHETMLEVMDKYGKDGQIAWVYRHFPLDMHPKARKEAEALECAFELGGNNAFWKYADKIFEITPANNGLDATMLPKIAEMIGLDGSKLQTCINSGKYAERVERDYMNGADVGVRGTPYTMIWNRKTKKQEPLNGAYPFANVKSILDKVITAPSAK